MRGVESAPQAFSQGHKWEKPALYYNNSLWESKETKDFAQDPSHNAEVALLSLPFLSTELAFKNPIPI